MKKDKRLSTDLQSTEHCKDNNVKINIYSYKSKSYHIFVSSCINFVKLPVCFAHYVINVGKIYRFQPISSPQNSLAFDFTTQKQLVLRKG
jgi:hypothetical protein